MLYKLPQPMPPLGAEERYRQDRQNAELELVELLNSDTLSFRSRRFYERRLEELREELREAA